MEKFTKGTLIKHRNGNVYRIIMLANTESERPEYPVTAVYEGVTNQKVWSRPLSDMDRSFTVIEEGEDAVNIKPEEIQVFSWSSKPHSGWSTHVPQGVHIIHLPTGIEVKEESHRSQHMNRDAALKRLDVLVTEARGE